MRQLTAYTRLAGTAEGCQLIPVVGCFVDVDGAVRKGFGDTPGLGQVFTPERGNQTQLGLIGDLNSFFSRGDFQY
ncbi:hypothetical protein D3C86_2198790 [compost metagenome]